MEIQEIEGWLSKCITIIFWIFLYSVFLDKLPVCILPRLSLQYEGNYAFWDGRSFDKQALNHASSPFSEQNCCDSKIKH